MTLLVLSRFNTFDFSQDYRDVENWEGIVFRDDWTGQDFRRCIWGLRVSQHYDDFQDRREIDKSSYEYQTLSARMDMQNVWQIVLSPDGGQILYVERIYRGTGVTDDEDVYFRVYQIEKDSVITIYAGFREFRLIDWKD